MDFVIGLPLDLNDVLNESLREWDSIMVIKKTRHPGRHSQCSSLTFSLFVFLLQKLVKESAHHAVVAALSAPTTQRAVSSPSTTSAHSSTPLSLHLIVLSLLQPFVFVLLQQFITPHIPTPNALSASIQIGSSTFHHNCHLLLFKTSNLSEQVQEKNKPIGSRLAAVIL